MEKPADEETEAAGPAPVRDTVSYDEFSRLKLRIATVTAAERVPKTDRLLRLELTLGEERRQIVAGIGVQYEPEAMVGRQIVVVANLEPAVFRGVESQGMLLAADGEDGPVLLRPDRDVPAGSRVR